MEKAETRQKLIDCAYEEIYSKGFQGASINDILKNAGVNKGSMYYFFKSKKELAIAAITEKMQERFSERYVSVSSRDGAYLRHFFEMLRDTRSRDFKRGCPLANLVQEMSNLDKDFDEALKAIYASFRAAVKKVLDKAIEAGEFKACDTDKLALFFIVVLEGAIMSAKASGDVKDFSDAIETLEAYVLGNFGCSD